MYVLKASFTVINAHNITVDSFFNLKDHSTSRLIQNNLDNFYQRTATGLNSRGSQTHLSNELIKLYTWVRFWNDQKEPILLHRLRTHLYPFKPQEAPCKAD